MRKRPQLLNYTTCLDHGIQIDFFQSSNTRMSPTRSILDSLSLVPLFHPCTIFLWLHQCKGEVLLKKEVTILYMCTNTTSILFSSNLRILHSNRIFTPPLGRWYETSPSSIEIQLEMTILSIIRSKLILMMLGKTIVESFSRLFWC